MSGRIYTVTQAGPPWAIEPVPDRDEAVAVTKHKVIKVPCALEYGSAEREAIGLCIALEAINDMANRALLDLPQPIGSLAEVEVHYRSREHQQLFLIRLLDFAKEAGNKSLTGVSGSCLDILVAACETKSFSQGAAVLSLERATSSLMQWLSTETTVQLWLPTLNLEAEVSVQRSEFLYILANHAKHNLSRLTGISERIARLLERNGYRVDLYQVPLALEDFREHLQEDYFVYYGTWLAELVNNLRWGIQDYLEETFRWAYLPGEGLAYSYRYPKSISNEIPKQWFWRLMNHVRSKPYIERFAGAEYMKRR
jgi:hypothetical protein